jgi:hypothetical protein
MAGSGESAIASAGHYLDADGLDADGLWSALRCRLLEASAILFLVMCFVLQSPAFSQTPATEDELERISREMAIKAASVEGYRWQPSQFPLRVAFASGEDLKKTDCPDQWQRQFEDYVRFINARQPLLKPTAITAGLDAFAFFGSVQELEALDAYRLLKTWLSKPDIVKQFQTLSMVSQSYYGGYGTGNFVQFGSAFEELEASDIRSIGHCNSVDAAHELSLALLQGYALNIRGLVSHRYGEQADPTLAWRVHRRLLSAMKKLPDSNMDSRQLRSALVEALSD